MSTQRLWVIAGSAAAVFVVLAILAAILLPRSPDPPTATVSATPTHTAAPPSPSASPTPTLTASTPTAAPVVATCENISSDAFRAQMSANGWISWETQDQQIGARPFDRFPNGSPEGQIVCRWGSDPQSATDNIIDLAWSPIDSENASAAIQSLEAAGYVRSDDAAGVHLSTSAGQDAYLFTLNDVRWAPTTAEVVEVTAPPLAG